MAFTGGRVVDNGTVFEPEGARTHRDFRSLGIYQLARNAVITEGVLPNWPHLERIRLVTGALEETLSKPHMFSIVEHSIRVSQNINGLL